MLGPLQPPPPYAGSRFEYLAPPHQEVARRRDRLQGHLWRRRRRPERLHIRAKNNYGNIEGKQISKQVGDQRSMFKMNKNSAPPAPLKKRRSDDALVLAGRKNGAWTPHDLRRTGATMMQTLGISLELIDRCQNHVLPGSKVRRHYMLHDYAEEKKAAWAALGERLARISLPN